MRFLVLLLLFSTRHYFYQWSQYETMREKLAKSKQVLDKLEHDIETGDTNDHNNSNNIVTLLLACNRPSVKKALDSVLA